MFDISAHAPAPSAPVPDPRQPARSWRFEPCGERCVILVFDTVFSIEANREAASVANILRTLASQASLPGITDVVAAMVTVGVHYSPLTLAARYPDVSPYDAVCQVLSAALQQSTDATSRSAKRIEIPVCYEADYAPDLAEVAHACALSVDEVIAAHTADWLDVLMVGFAPGHPYIGLHPPALSLPRRSVPRKRVAKGSVGIANGQSVIYPAELPGGWNLVGRTPLDLFSPFNDVPCLLKGGDQVRFIAISSREFEALARGESL